MVKRKNRPIILLTLLLGFLSILLFFNHNYLFFASEEDDTIEDTIASIEAQKNQTPEITYRCQILLQEGEKDA